MAERYIRYTFNVDANTATVIGEALATPLGEGSKEKRLSLAQEAKDIQKVLDARKSPGDDPEGTRRRLDRLAQIRKEMRGDIDIQREIMGDLYNFFPSGITKEQAEDPAVLMEALDNLLKSRGTTLDEVRKDVATARARGVSKGLSKLEIDAQIKKGLSQLDISDVIINILMR